VHRARRRRVEPQRLLKACCDVAAALSCCATALGQLVADYLVAQAQALVADPRVTGRCYGLDLVAALPAEAASGTPRARRLSRLLRRPIHYEGSPYRLGLRLSARRPA
jgi:hypothetical protein